VLTDPPRSRYPATAKEHFNETRSFLRLILAALTGLALVAPLTVTAESRRGRTITPAYPDQIDLPDGFLPEGIAIGPGPTGSRSWSVPLAGH
jgi:hypothetical protein